MKNIIKSYFGNKRGMTLVEVLTAMAILSLIVFCFTPLFLTYYESITIAGDKIADVNTQSGVMQTVIGASGTVAPDKYSAPVANLDLSLKVAKGTSVCRGEVEGTVSADASITMGTEVDDIKGNFLLSDKENLLNSYVTVDGAGTGSAFTCFPTSLTDDFYKATITLCASGFSFNDNPKFTITCDGGKIPLSENSDYTVKKINEKMVAITFFGGGDVSFETSPIVVKYGSFNCEIEVDAPSMIMVGEANAAGKYHYYVSRGEVDSDTDSLIVIQREMNSDGVTLTSAMNDVEWVPAESGDGYNAVNGEKYGYYVMCGDQGQIRRFWKNNITGNYYWGGDYTYYTDINIDEVTGTTRYNSTKTTTPKTEVDYSYVYRGSHNAGFVMGGYSDLKLMNANTFTINALDTDKRGSNGNIAVYIPDGEVYYFQKLKTSDKNDSLEDSVSTRDKMVSAFTSGTVGGVTVEGLDRYWNINLATDWFAVKDNSVYYAINNKGQEANMITLTSVDAIVISENYTKNNTAKAGGPYYTVGTDGAQYSSSGIEYPTSSYNLYCGYIPAVMDAWSNGSSRNPDNDKEQYFRNHNDVSHSDLLTITSTMRNGGTFTLKTADFGSWPRWKGTYGMIAYTEDGTGEISYGKMQSALDKHIRTYIFPDGTRSWNYDITYYPFTNVKFAAIGKAFDNYTPITSELVGDFTSFVSDDASHLTIPQVRVVGGDEYNQQNVTGGQIIDITMSYLSHPLAIARTLNPTDDKIYDNANNKDGNRIFYWHNSRDSATYLDCASTIAPSGENDVNVSLMVGYVTGGLAEYTGGSTKDDVFVNAIMNNGIVLLRAGSSNTGTHNNSANFHSNEDIATDNSGYKLDSESNAFHQFYYLNSRTEGSTAPQRSGAIGQGTYHIGDLYGANYWQNNRHIQYISTDGTAAYSSSNTGTYSYLRSHPMSNTKVNCVTWGTTWQGYPEAMWGTENGTLISWDIDLVAVKKVGQTGSEEDEHEWNDKSVDAEFQSYMWIDNCNNKTFNVVSYTNILGAGDHEAYWGTIGSAIPNSASPKNKGSTFNSDAVAGTSFHEFADRCSRDVGTKYGAEWQNATSFISVLKSVNDVAFANNTWVAVGDWSGKHPADYCGKGATLREGYDLVPYTDEGKDAGSWVNVKYWVDVAGDGKLDGDNNTFLWKAVKISNNDKYNIVQINCLNGMWIATGYIDENKNGVQDDGEETAISWTYNPLNSCNSKEEARWRDEVVFYKNTGNGIEKIKEENIKTEVGAINSCATRNE